MWATDDPAQLHVTPDREFAGFAEGIIREWNADTFRNTVEVRRAHLHDLGVASGLEALTYAPGDVVILTRWKPRSGRGSATYRIGMGGRVIVPGTGAAETAIAFMRTSLGRSISAEVFADRIGSDSVAAIESTSSTSYTDLSTVGPTVPDVDVTDTGKAIAFVSVEISTNLSGGLNEGGHVGIEVSGATSISPTSRGDMRLSVHTAVGGDTDAGTILLATGTALYDPALGNGLNEGTHAFELKYKRLFSGSASVSFSNRTLVVIAL